jgi:PIN domain nuclease of toxin-antitoxin system
VKPLLADASAIQAWLQFEPGGEVVSQHLPDLRLTAVNLAEIVAVLTQRGIAKDWIESRVLRVFSDIIPLDREQAALTGYLVPQTQKLGLSLGDRACLAAGITLDAKVLTADAAWQTLKLGIEIVLIR